MCALARAHTALDYLGDTLPFAACLLKELQRLRVKLDLWLTGRFGVTGWADWSFGYHGDHEARELNANSSFEPHHS